MTSDDGFIKRFISCLVLFGIFICPASAEKGLYLGVAAGRIHLSSDFAQQVASVHAQDAASPDDIGADASRSTGGRLFAGFWLSRHFALEFDYVSLGEIATRYTTFGDFLISGPGALSSRSFTRFEHATKFDGPGLSAIGSLPLNENFDVFVRTGMVRLRSRSNGQTNTFIGIADNLGRPDPLRSTFIGGGPVATDTKQTRRIVGLGAQFRIADRLRLRATWDRYFDVGKPVERFTPQAAGEHDIDLMTVGMSYEF